VIIHVSANKQEIDSIGHSLPLQKLGKNPHNIIFDVAAGFFCQSAVICKILQHFE